VLTGDFMSYQGDEDAGMAMFETLSPLLRPRLGAFGVFGNHDTQEFRERCRSLPVRWVGGRRERVDDSLDVVGFEMGPSLAFDSVAHLLSDGELPRTDARPLRLVLAHSPVALAAASDLGADVVFSGHTHGGQCRLPFKRALMNSTDLPLHLTSGVLRHRNTLCLISRGLGEVKLPLRVLCPPQLPVYTLRRGPLPGEFSHGITNTMPW
jgi:predicted MPP superfamily phosphohydrolase